MHNNLLKIVKESGIHFSGSLVGRVLGYGWLMLINRVLTPKEFGTFILAESIINISLIFVLFGTPKALERFIPYYNAAGEEGKTKTLIRDVLKITLALSGATGIILFFGSGILASTLFNDSALSQVLNIMVLTIPLYAFIKVVSASFIGYKELRYQVYFQQITKRALRLILTSILLMAGLGLLSWVWMYFLSLVGTGALALWFFRKNILSVLLKVASQPVNFKNVLSYSWPLSIVSIITIVLGQIDLIFLGIFRPSADVGMYKIYFTLVAILRLGLISLARIYKPILSSLIPQDSMGELRGIYQQTSKWFIAVTFLGFLGIVFLGKNLVAVLFGEAYVVVPLTLYVLATTHLVTALTGPDGMTLQAFGNTKLVMLNTSLMLVINVILNFLLIPTYGILGAAVATASATAINHLAGLIEIYKLYEFHPFGWAYVKYAIAGLATASLYFLLSRFVSIPGVAGLFSQGILLAVIYCVCAYLFGGIDQVDLAILAQVKRKIVGR